MTLGIILVSGSVIALLVMQGVGNVVSFFNQTPDVIVSQSPTSISAQQLHSLAQSITVKVFAGNSWASGVLVNRNGTTYGVLTSEHLLLNEKQFRIQTSDGRFYPARLVDDTKLNSYDLRQLVFESDSAVYEVASLKPKSTLSLNEEVFAAGFSSEAMAAGSTGFVVAPGKILLLPQKTLRGGYQIGYTNRVEKGMSGGPLLNARGQLIGINGMDKYPLWGNPYVFQDGSSPSIEQQEKMRQLSWAIPVKTPL